MGSSKPTSNWALRVVRVNQFFSKPIGMLLGIALMSMIIVTFFALQSAAIQRDTRLSARNAELAAEKSQVAAQNTEKISSEINHAAKESKNDNKQQTLILCRVILRGNLGIDLAPDEEQVIEDICHLELERQAAIQAENTRAEAEQVGEDQQPLVVIPPPTNRIRPSPLVHPNPPPPLTLPNGIGSLLQGLLNPTFNLLAGLL